MSEVCPGCRSPEVGTQLSVPEMMFGVDATFGYAACARCGTVRLVDPPGDMSPFYPQDYYSVELDPETALGRRGVRQFATAVGRSRVGGRNVVARAAVAALRQRQFRTLMSILESVRVAGGSNAARILDVGCGSGMLVYELSLVSSAQVVGVDPFASATRTFDTGARIVKQDLSEVSGQFDVVMFHHSLEHVPDPAQSLRDAQDRLSPGGAILVRMPTVSSAAFERYGSNWVQFDAPRHVTIFSRPGFAQLVQAEGLRVESITDDSTAFQFWGSEQVRNGVPLSAQQSHMIDPKRSLFSSDQIRAWDKEARDLNVAGRGDQAAWVLRSAA